MDVDDLIAFAAILADLDRMIHDLSGAADEEERPEERQP